MKEIIIKEDAALSEFSYLCSMFDLTESLAPCASIVEELKLESDEIMNLWRIHDGLVQYMSTISALKWQDINIEELEEGAKVQMKNIKLAHKCTHWSDAYKRIDKKCKDLLASMPHIALLESPAMCERH